MLSEDRYFRDLTEAELWQRYCGFLDLSIDEFMDMQEELLMDEIERVSDSFLGKKIMGNRKPKSVEEFRQMVPLTTYDDYEPYLSEQREDVLAIKPEMWGHSAGRGGRFKWIPLDSEFLEKVTKTTLSSLILAVSKKKGKVDVAPGIRVLFILPPAPYASNCLVQSFTGQFSFEQIPPQDLAQNMEIQDRIKKGFQIALKDGVDVIAAIASVLVRMGEEISGQARGIKFSASMLHPKVLRRLLQAWLRSRKEKRPILPRDLWAAKAIMTSGVDTTIYRKDIGYYWGSEPYEFYSCTEALFLAIQSLNRTGMIFLPDLAFLEFIPYEEQLQHHDDKDYRPSTVLLDEVEKGKSYEVVITHFYGMPLLRYRMGDIVKVVAVRDDQTGVNLPHVVFQRRIGETINIGGLAELDEKTIWQAIANTGLKYTDWSARKEYEGNQAFLRLYIELKEHRKAREIATMIDKQLKITDTDYKDIDAYLKLQPVRVTLLSPGTFQSYIEEKRREGADLAHLKPSHVNSPETTIKRLLQLSKAMR